jgi:polysaccharide biosynthesis transport protein
MRNSIQATTDLEQYLMLFRRWGWILLISIGITSAAGYLISSRQRLVYESTSHYLVGAAVDKLNVSSSDLNVSSQIGQIYAALVGTQPVLQRVNTKLNINIYDTSVVNRVAVTWQEPSKILSIHARAYNPGFAAKVANALGEALVEYTSDGTADQQRTGEQDAIIQIAKLQENIRVAQADVDKFVVQIQQMSSTQQQHTLIARLEARRVQIESMRWSLAEQEQRLAQSDANRLTLVDPAIPEMIPVAPNLLQNVLIGLIGGAILGLVAMLMFEYFTDVIYTPEDLQMVSSIPYLCGIVRYKKLRGARMSRLIVQRHPTALAVESYRILRTNVLNIASGQLPPSMLVTSPSRGDGKSEVAANLAVALTQLGKRVILVDANLRRPRIAVLLGLKEGAGLSNLLDRSEEALESVSVEVVPGLKVILAGNSALNSPELLGSPRLRQLIRCFKTQADIVVVDSPPTVYAETLTLASQVDSVLLIVNSGTTGRDATENAIESLHRHGTPLLGAVLNRVPPPLTYDHYPGTMTKHSA